MSKVGIFESVFDKKLFPVGCQLPACQQKNLLNVQVSVNMGIWVQWECLFKVHHASWPNGPACGQDERSHTTENITFPQLHWRTVTSPDIIPVCV